MLGQACLAAALGYMIELMKLHLEPRFLVYVWYMYGIYHTYVDLLHMYGICMVYVWYILGYTIHMYSNGYTMYIQGYTWYIHLNIHDISMYIHGICFHGYTWYILGYTWISLAS